MSRSFYLFLVALCVLVLLALFGRSFTRDSKVPGGASPSVTPVTGNETPSDPPEGTPGPRITRVSIFLVALEDNGKSGRKIGCGDSLIPVARDIQATTAPLRSALEELLSLKSQTLGESGLYNALYQSQLIVEKAVITDGTAQVSLRGMYTLGGTCDTPRFSEQLKETVLQFSNVQEAVILLNGKDIDEVLSQR